MCTPGYHQNGFVATQALGHMMYVMYIYIYIKLKVRIETKVVSTQSFI